MVVTEIHELSAQELGAAYRRGDTDPIEVTDYLLERAQVFNDSVGAYAHITAEYARKQAHAAMEALKSEDPRPLLGVPCPIKDLTQVAGLPFEAGSKVLAGTIASMTSGVAERLDAAGTICLGKTTTPEFGFPAYSEPAIGLPARTPWDTQRTAGGSSGGAATAVSAGLSPIAHGSDAGGSVRIPAACCGVVGLKPSRGRISPGPLNSSGPGLATDGVLAQTVADIATVLTAMSGNRPGDTFLLTSASSGNNTFVDAVLQQEDVLTSAKTQGGANVPLRVGVLTQPLICPPLSVHPEALVAVERATNLLSNAGCIVEPAPLPFAWQQWQAFMPIWSVGAASIPLPPGGYNQLLPYTRWLVDTGRHYAGTDYAKAITELQFLAAQIAQSWVDFDAIITPSLSGPPAFPETLQLADPAADFQAQCEFTPWTSTWNILGAPAMSVPLHRAIVEGSELPFGVQIGATRIGDEKMLLQMARVLELAAPWPRLAPQSR